jgi:protoheme IX farnesyltransferase
LEIGNQLIISGSQAEQNISIYRNIPALLSVTFARLPETAIHIAKSAGPMGKVTEYAQFTKLRLSALVVFSAIIGYAIALEELKVAANWLEMTMLFVGGFLVTGASNGYNQVIERDYDKLMPRTASRPIPTGKMTPSEGITVATFCAVTGAALLWIFVNPLSAILSVIALLLYVFAYTPMKRISPWAVLVGAFPGAMPPMLGWVAATEGFGFIGTNALLLFAVQFMWQFPHFWAIAWVVDEDYRKAGFRLLPTKERDKGSAFQVMVYAMFLIPMSLLPYFYNMTGIIGISIVLLCGILFFYQAWKLYSTLEVKAASKLMFGSFIYLPVVQLAYLFG